VVWCCWWDFSFFFCFVVSLKLLRVSVGFCSAKCSPILPPTLGFSLKYLQERESFPFLFLTFISFGAPPPLPCVTSPLYTNPREVSFVLFFYNKPSLFFFLVPSFLFLRRPPPPHSVQFSVIRFALELPLLFSEGASFHIDAPPSFFFVLHLAKNFFFFPEPFTHKDPHQLS